MRGQAPGSRQAPSLLRRYDPMQREPTTATNVNRVEVLVFRPISRGYTSLFNLIKINLYARAATGLATLLVVTEVQLRPVTEGMPLLRNAFSTSHHRIVLRIVFLEANRATSEH